ncbi:MAG TPA: right-handed parallel beta-helix repeat-containing protein, partial [Myxococcaceae bacterium]|nr:right-handed parallel beta-helix repeat-containing protein [Myxococcaceae bacterium]
VAYVLNNLPKAGFFVDTVEPYETAASASARPAGRDWFVRAGATGGDGSREKPFKDPYQALEKVQSGDTVHVAEGEYLGKLHAGQWKIETSYVALLGGYDRDFKSRNPWKHPTRLYTAADYKGYKSGYTIEGANDHTGATVDGFVFDKRGNNVYTRDGDLDYGDSDKSPHLWLSKPGCAIRNNVFLNGAEGALRVVNGQTVENNIFVNHVMKTVDVQQGNGNAPFVFRHNTVAFVWDERFGKGLGATGSLLKIGTHLAAVVEDNIFEFADNDAIVLDAAAKDVELVRNTFSHNLWSHVQKTDGWVVVDSRSWGQLADLGWKKQEGNQLVSADLPLDQKWFDVYLHRTAMVPGKVTMDDWNQLREVLGQPVMATGGEAGKGFAPAFEWKAALTLFPRSTQVTAGARASDLPVQFNGTNRKEESHDYQEVSWEAAKSADAWSRLEGKRVALKVVIRETDNQYLLNDIKKEEWQAFTVCGPEGSDSGGLPLRAYVKKGTTAERVLQKARGYSSGAPEETHLLKGVVRGNHQLVAEVVERAD